MAGCNLYGWDATNGIWVKLICNEEGKLIIDPSEILEDDPTDNEVGKAPTSNWAFDHNADASAHHLRYTHNEASAVVLTHIEIIPTNNEYEKAPCSNWAYDHENNASAHHTKTTAGELNHNDLANISSDDHHTKTTAGELNHNDLANISSDDHHSRYTNAEALSVVTGQIEITPTNNEFEKAPSSNWGYDHQNNASAHHSKYTDAEAVSAVSTADDYLKNNGDNATGDYNFDSGTLVVDSSNNRVGVNKSSPTVAFHVGDRAYFDYGRMKSGYRSVANVTEDNIFDSLDPYIPDTGDDMLVTGCIIKSGVFYYLSHAYRSSSTVIYFYGVTSAGGIAPLACTNGSSATYYRVGIAW